MNIGILGAGRMGQALARLLIQGGHSVTLASSGRPDSLAPLTTELGPRAFATSSRDLARSATVIALAVRWPQLPEAIRAMGDLRGHIVIDATNNRFGPGPDDLYDVGQLTSSEVVNALVPGAHLVKAFNNQPIAALATLLDARSTVRKALFLAGDHGSAKAVVARIIRDLGAEPVDAGTLRCGGRLMATRSGPLAGLGRLLTVPEARALLDGARRALPDCTDAVASAGRPASVA